MCCCNRHHANQDSNAVNVAVYGSRHSLLRLWKCAGIESRHHSEPAPVRSPTKGISRHCLARGNVSASTITTITRTGQVTGAGRFKVVYPLRPPKTRLYPNCTLRKSARTLSRPLDSIRIRCSIDSVHQGRQWRFSITGRVQV
jgi:hypothetical protein